MKVLAHYSLKMNLHNLNFTSIAGLIAIGTIVATTWGYIKQIMHYLFGLVIGTATIRGDAGKAVMAYTFKNAIASPFGSKIYGGYESYVHPKKWIESVAYKGLSFDPMLIKYKKFFALVSLLNPDSSEGKGYNNTATVSVKYLRCWFNIEQFIIDAVEVYNNQKRFAKDSLSEIKNKEYSRNRFKVIRLTGNGASREQNGSSSSKSNSPVAVEDSDSIEMMVMTGVFKLLNWKIADLQMKMDDGKSPFTGYPFPNEIRESIIELDCWLKNEKWFRSKSIPWRRGWLLHGQPGTGKTTLIRALGMSFDMPLFVFDLADMTNNDFIKYWDELMSNTPCIALIEDIDAIFDGRKFVGNRNKMGSNITFDCLLNCISGVKQADGVFLAITTNHIEKIDPAIGIPDKDGKSSRPGRIDKAIHLGNMAQEQRITLAKHILSDYPELVESTVSDGEGETAAQFQNRCATIALEKFWQDPKFKDGKYVPELNQIPSSVVSVMLDAGHTIKYETEDFS